MIKMLSNCGAVQKIPNVNIYFPSSYFIPLTVVIVPLTLTNIETVIQQTAPNSGNATIQFENINFGSDTLPVQCHWSLGVGVYTGNGSSLFEVLSQDPNLAAKTWSATVPLSATTPSTSISTPASTTSAGDNSGSDSTTQSAAAQTSSPSGLSTGAKAGIAVGSVVGALAILAALGIIIFGARRRRRQRQQPQQEQQEYTTSAEKSSFLSSPSDDHAEQGPHGLYSGKPELDARQTKYEAAATDDDQEKRRVGELDAAANNNIAPRAELEADGVGHQLDS